MLPDGDQTEKIELTKNQKDGKKYKNDDTEFYQKRRNNVLKMIFLNIKQQQTSNTDDGEIAYEIAQIGL